MSQNFLSSPLADEAQPATGEDKREATERKASPHSGVAAERGSDSDFVGVSVNGAMPEEKGKENEEEEKKGELRGSFGVSTGPCSDGDGLSHLAASFKPPPEKSSSIGNYSPTDSPSPSQGSWTTMMQRPPQAHTHSHSRSLLSSAGVGSDASPMPHDDTLIMVDEIECNVSSAGSAEDEEEWVDGEEEAHEPTEKEQTTEELKVAQGTTPSGFGAGMASTTTKDGEVKDEAAAPSTPVQQSYDSSYLTREVGGLAVAVGVCGRRHLRSETVEYISPVAEREEQRFTPQFPAACDSSSLEQHDEEGELLSGVGLGSEFSPSPSRVIPLRDSGTERVFAGVRSRSSYSSASSGGGQPVSPASPSPLGKPKKYRRSDSVPLPLAARRQLLLFEGDGSSASLMRRGASPPARTSPLRLEQLSSPDATNNNNNNNNRRVGGALRSTGTASGGTSELMLSSVPLVTSITIEPTIGSACSSGESTPEEEVRGSGKGKIIIEDGEGTGQDRRREKQEAALKRAGAMEAGRATRRRSIKTGDPFEDRKRLFSPGAVAASRLRRFDEEADNTVNDKRPRRSDFSPQSSAVALVTEKQCPLNGAGLHEFDVHLVVLKVNDMLQFRWYSADILKIVECNSDFVELPTHGRHSSDLAADGSSGPAVAPSTAPTRGIHGGEQQSAGTGEHKQQSHTPFDIEQLSPSGVPTATAAGQGRASGGQGKFVEKRHTVQFPADGRYFFRGANPLDEDLFVEVIVRRRKKDFLRNMFKFLAGGMMLVLLIIGLILTAALVLDTEFLLLPDTSEGDPVASEGMREIQTLLLKYLAPWFVFGALWLIGLVVARLAYCCHQSRLTDFGRGFTCTQHRRAQFLVVIVTIPVLALVFSYWWFFLAVMFHWSSFFKLLGASILTTLNEVLGLAQNIEFLREELPKQFNITVPVNTPQILQDVEQVSESIKVYIDSGEEITAGVFRALAVIVFLALQAVLASASYGVVAALKRKSDLMRTAVWLMGCSLVIASFALGAAWFAKVILERAMHVISAFEDDALSFEDFRRATASAPNSTLSNLFGMCLDKERFDTTFLHRALDSLASAWNQRASNAGFPLYILPRSNMTYLVSTTTTTTATANATATVIATASAAVAVTGIPGLHKVEGLVNVTSLLDYGDFLSAQLDILSAKLSQNPAALQALAPDFNSKTAPTLRACIAVVNSLIGLLDCQLIRQTTAEATKVLRGGVARDMDISLALHLSLYVLHFLFIFLGFAVARVFARPFKQWFEPRSGRWFRFRCSFLAHKRILDRAEKAELLEQQQLMWSDRDSSTTAAASAAVSRCESMRSAGSRTSVISLSPPLSPMSISLTLREPQRDHIPTPLSADVDAANGEEHLAAASSRPVLASSAVALPPAVAQAALDSLTTEDRVSSPRSSPPPHSSGGTGVRPFRPGSPAPPSPRSVSSGQSVRPATPRLTKQRWKTKTTMYDVLLGIFQVNLANSFLLLAQAILLVLLHQSSKENHLSTLLQMVCLLCATAPIFAFPTEFVRNVYVRGIFRVLGLWVTAAAATLSATNANLAVRESVACVEEINEAHVAIKNLNSTMLASTTTVLPFTERCTAEVVVMQLSVAVYSLVVALVCVIAALTNLVLLFFVWVHHSSPRQLDRLGKRRSSTGGPKNVLRPRPGTSSVELNERRSRVRAERSAFCMILILGLPTLICLAVVILTDVLASPQMPAASLFTLPSTGCNGAEEYCDKRIDELVWLTTHNAMSSMDDHFFAPNHFTGVPVQIEVGVRAFMLDVWLNSSSMLQAEAQTGGGTNNTAEQEQRSFSILDQQAKDLLLCHGTCNLGSYPLSRDLLLFRQFLELNTTSIIVLFIEQQSAVDTAVLARAFDLANLTDYLWPGMGYGKPTLTTTSVDGTLVEGVNTTFSWPTFRSLVNSNHRLLLFTDRPRAKSTTVATDADTDTPPSSVSTADGDGVAPPPSWMLYMWDYCFETPFSVPNSSEFGCTINRGNVITDTASPPPALASPLSPSAPLDNGMPKSPLGKKLAVLNHFVSLPAAAPNLAAEANGPKALSAHFFQCFEDWGEKVPNFLAVDYWTLMDPMRTVNDINHYLARRHRVGRRVDIVKNEGYEEENQTVV